jgi:2-polyprenyl-6-methoxyphenol hydroxylase-like FAD-dependent oxidoreductase
MSKWGNVVKDIQAISSQPPSMTMYNKDGKELLTAPLPKDFDGHPVLFSNRGYIQKVIAEYAQSLGVKLRLNSRVTSYFENADNAGVIVGDQIVTADAVIACDGIHSTARKYILGAQQLARTSGFAVYRSWFPLERLANDPFTERFVNSKVDEFYVWIGPDIHVILFTTIAVRGAVVFVTHKVRTPFSTPHGRLTSPF